MVFFDFDRSEVRPVGRAALDAKIPLLRANPSLRLSIEGHADERGSDEYNLALAMRRAASAKRYLMSYGIEATRLDVKSFGEEQPMDTGHTEAAWSRNRRAEFHMIGSPVVSSNPGTSTTGKENNR